MTEAHGGAEDVNQPTHPPAAEKPSHEAVVLLLKRAEQGDQSVLAELRKLLNDNPALWQSYSDLAAQASASLIQLAAGKNLLLAESLLLKTEAMKEELAGPAASPLERVLAARVVACWLQTSHLDALVAQARDGNPARAKLLMQQQDAAHRRQLSAAKTLAVVRKLLTPTPSPVAIATRLGKEQGTRLRVVTPAEGVPVEN
jgi:hypothetical protein